MSCGSCSHARPGRRGAPPTSTWTSPARRSSSRTGVTSTVASARRCRRPRSFSPATSLDTLERIKAFQKVRARGTSCDRRSRRLREIALDGVFDAMVTSPPYPGLIDYHEQHRYAYELLELDDRRERELGAAARGTSRSAVDEYVSGIAAVLRRMPGPSRPGRRYSSSSTIAATSIRRFSSGAASARRTARAPRQPSHRPSVGRVLRVRPGRCTGNVSDPWRPALSADVGGSLARRQATPDVAEAGRAPRISYVSRTQTRIDSKYSPARRPVRRLTWRSSRSSSASPLRSRISG